MGFEHFHPPEMLLEVVVGRCSLRFDDVIYHTCTGFLISAYCYHSRERERRERLCPLSL